MFMSCRFLLQPRHVDGVLYVDFYGISTVNNVLEQTADPADLSVLSVVPSEPTSTVPPQGRALIITSLPMTLIFTNHNHCHNFPVDIIPSAAPADQPKVPTVSSSQRREIALKQVSYLISTLYY